MKKEYLKNNKPVMILGNPHTGKTNLGVALSKLSERKLYTLGYPKEIKGFTGLNYLDDIFKINNCTLFIDEIDEIIDFYDKRDNKKFRELLKFAWHNDIKLIANTQLSQFINKSCEALVPCWAITNIDMFGLKNGSKPKRIVKDTKHPCITSIGMKLELGQFIWYDDTAQAGENGVYKFPDQGIGKDWKNATKTAKESARKK
jgi:hypothetical protein